METQKAYFEQDAEGWWYVIPKTRKRLRAEIRTCEECCKEYAARIREVGRVGRFCSIACGNRANGREKRGEKHHRWKGGRFVTDEGYVKVLDPDRGTVEQQYNGNVYVLEHRLVMSEHLGRPLLATETVHHKNGDRADNRLENLELRVGAHGQGATHAHCATCTCFA